MCTDSCFLACSCIASAALESSPACTRLNPKFPALASSRQSPLPPAVAPVTDDDVAAPVAAQAASAEQPIPVPPVIQQMVRAFVQAIMKPEVRVLCRYSFVIGARPLLVQPCCCYKVLHGFRPGATDRHIDTLLRCSQAEQPAAEPGCLSCHRCCCANRRGDGSDGGAAPALDMQPSADAPEQPALFAAYPRC